MVRLHKQVESDSSDDLRLQRQGANVAKNQA